MAKDREAPTLPAPQPPARPARPDPAPPPPPESDLERDRREAAALRPRPARPDPAAPEPPRPHPDDRAAAPDLAQLDALAVNDARPGRRLYLVSLKGHRSRAWDHSRQAPVMLERLPVWAESVDEADRFFRAYHVGLTTVHPIVKEAVPGSEDFARRE